MLYMITHVGHKGKLNNLKLMNGLRVKPKCIYQSVKESLQIEGNILA